MRHGRSLSRVRVLAAFLGCLIVAGQGCGRNEPDGFDQFRVNLEGRERLPECTAPPPAPVDGTSWPLDAAGSTVVLDGFEFRVPRSWEVTIAKHVPDSWSDRELPVALCERGSDRLFAKWDEQTADFLAEGNWRERAYCANSLTVFRVDGFDWPNLVRGYTTDRQFWDAVFNTVPGDVDLEKMIRGMKSLRPLSEYEDEIVKYWMLEARERYGFAEPFVGAHYTGYWCVHDVHGTLRGMPRRDVEILFFEPDGKMVGCLTLGLAPVGKGVPGQACPLEQALPPELCDAAKTVVFSFQKIPAGAEPKR